MLILNRKIQEAINIGNDITITVVAIRGNRVRIGINAPRELRVDREEIRERIQREAAQAVYPT